MTRVLVRAPNWLGDLVMALPALAGLRRHFAGERLIVAAPAPLAPLCALFPGVDKVIGLERAGGPWRRIRGEAGQLARSRGTLGILLTNSFGSALAMRLAGTPERWGYGTDLRGPLLTRTVGRPWPRREVRHQAEYYQGLLRGLGIETGPREPRIEVPPADVARARALLEQQGVREGEPLVGLAPGAAYGHAKRWPPDRVAALVRRLMSETAVSCVLIGSAGDRGAGAAIESALAAGGPLAAGGRTINLIGRTDLRMLLGVLAACRAFVSNDSGAMHLAAAVGLPVTAIFGPTDERATGPLGRHHVVAHQVWCRPCHLRECPIDHRCMKGVNPDTVFELVAGGLGGPETARP